MDLLVTHPVKKSDLGFHGNLFGGKLLSWIDAAIAAYAMEVCHTNSIITVAIDKCVFKRPAKEGNLIKIYALVSKMGDTSVTFEVEARTYNVFRGDEQIILNTHMTFVRVDNEGVPISISETVKKRFQPLESKL
jgi:acyl-CoA thioesterase YciA